MTLDLYSPHAGQELHETAIAKGHRDSNIGNADTTGLEVDSGQDKGSQSESAQSKRGRVGEPAVLDGLVQTRLEFTTESWQTSLVGTVQVHVGIAAIVVALLDGTLGMCTIGIIAGSCNVLLELGIRHVDWWSILLNCRWLGGSRVESGTFERTGNVWRALVYS